MDWMGASKVSRSPTTTTSSATESLVEPGRMKFAYFGNEFPHDDFNELLRHLSHHSKERRHPILARFIHEATLAVREEVCLLSAQLRALVPPRILSTSIAQRHVLLDWEPVLHRPQLCHSHRLWQTCHLLVLG